MKRVLFLLTSATCALSAAEDNWTLNNVFTLYGDFAYFKREQATKHKLVIDNPETDCLCRFESCNTKDLAHRFDFEPGFKVGTTYMTEHTVWDFFYLWTGPWHSHCSRSSTTGSLIFSVKHPDLIADFNEADQGEADYTSQFQNCELNFYRYSALRHDDFFSAAWMVGARYMTLRESIDIAFTKGANKSSYKVHVSNPIPAIQIGGLIAWNPTSKISWDFLVKVGLGFDAGEQKTDLGDLNNPQVARDYKKSGFSTPLVAEGSMTLTYQSTSYLELHAAYQVIYLNGVALAPDQIVKSSSNTPVYRAIGQPLIHGLTVGLGWSF